MAMPGSGVWPADGDYGCVCPVCEGDGDCGDPYMYIPCPRCGGSGRVDTLDDDEGDEDAGKVYTDLEEFFADLDK